MKASGATMIKLVDSQVIMKFFLPMLLFLPIQNVIAQDLDAIRQEGVLRHLGIPYANFVTGHGDGLDVELIQGFAAHLGLRYEFIETDWRRVIGDLTGHHVRSVGQNVELLGSASIRGDVAASGITILEWRKQVVAFSDPTFPADVWLVARADSELAPISPTGRVADDIRLVKAMLSGVSVLTFPDTCLDSALFAMESTGADVRMQRPNRKLNEMVPAILNNDAETTLLDIHDAIMALDRWPGQVKVIGPISVEQYMAAAFRPESPRLLEAFNSYLRQIRSDGTYNRLVERYYPAVFPYFNGFFHVPLRE